MYLGLKAWWYPTNVQLASVAACGIPVISCIGNILLALHTTSTQTASPEKSNIQYERGCFHNIL
jgi:hypothetical protein